MKPNDKLVTIHDNVALIKGLLNDLVLSPRINAIKWSKITKQTPNIKIGYPGQHLASLITGMEGQRTGARGNDLVDGTEVKSCSRIDPLDKCSNCNSPVSRLEDLCPQCNSSNILRSNDSKWLFAIRDKDELDILLHKVKRVLLIIGDYPNFNDSDWETLRFQSFELWPESKRNSRFSEIMTNYYNKIYLEHKKKDPNKSPAPKNFWPYQYQFYICNPIPTFSCIIQNSATNPQIQIQSYLEPNMDRSKSPSVLMPPNILNEPEFNLIINHATDAEFHNFIKPQYRKIISKNKLKLLNFSQKLDKLVGIDENLRKYLPLRDTDRIATARTPYSRRRVG